MQVEEKSTLSSYVKELMASRNMTIHEVRTNATADITESYISGIIKGSSSNPSVRKLVALASGLGVDPVELFKIAAGQSTSDQPHSFLAQDAAALMATMRTIVSTDRLFDVMNQALLLEPDDRAAALTILRRINDASTIEQRKSARLA